MASFTKPYPKQFWSLGLTGTRFDEKVRLPLCISINAISMIKIYRKSTIEIKMLELTSNYRYFRYIECISLNIHIFDISYPSTIPQGGSGTLYYVMCKNIILLLVLKY